MQQTSRKVTIKPTLIILAGGKSSRMGTDKALLTYKNKTFVQMLCDNLSGICSDVIISSNNPKVKVPEAKTIADEIKDIGPIGGIYTSLKFSETDFNFVVSVDTPFVSATLLSEILSQSNGYDVSVTEFQNKIHPTIGVYRKNITTLLFSEIDAEKYKMLTAIKKTKYQIIPIRETYKDVFLNINNPKEYEFFLKKG